MASISPVLLKEVRQAVRNRLVVSVLFFLLFLFVFGTGALLALASDGSLPGGEAGPFFFQVLFAGFVIPVFLFIPLHTAANLIWERQNGTLELISATTLSEHQIVLGKVGGGLVLGLFYLSLVSPFLLLTFFLRGVDIFAILAVLLMTVFMLSGAIYWAVFWTVMRVNRAIKWFFYLIALCGLFGLIGLSLGLSISIVEWGAGVFLKGIPWLILFLTFWLIGVLFAHAIAIDQIRNIRWEYQYIYNPYIPYNPASGMIESEVSGETASWEDDLLPPEQD